MGTLILAYSNISFRYDGTRVPGRKRRSKNGPEAGKPLLYYIFSFLLSAARLRSVFRLCVHQYLAGSFLMIGFAKVCLWRIVLDLTLPLLLSLLLTTVPRGRVQAGKLFVYCVLLFSQLP